MGAGSGDPRPYGSDTEKPGKVRAEPLGTLPQGRPNDRNPDQVMGCRVPNICMNKGGGEGVVLGNAFGASGWRVRSWASSDLL
jgi:hypothetical protein